MRAAIVLALAVAACEPSGSLEDRFAELAIASAELARSPAPSVGSESAARAITRPAARIVVTMDAIVADDAWPALAAWAAEPQRLEADARDHGAGVVLAQGPFEVAPLANGRGADLDGPIQHALDRLSHSVERFSAIPAASIDWRDRDPTLLIHTDPRVPFETVARIACLTDVHGPDLGLVVGSESVPTAIRAQRGRRVIGHGGGRFTMWLRYEGITLLTCGVALVPGCETTGGAETITVPRDGEGYDLVGLASCLSHLTTFPGMDELGVVADHRIPWGRAVEAIAVATGSETAPRFRPVLCPDDEGRR